MNNRYEIREEIGKGGLGAVYKAFDNQLHREVAMKRVLTTEQGSADEVEAAANNLIGEAQTLSSLNHPNIVTVFDVGRDEQGGFVVMELLKGETLDETVERGVLTQDDFIEVVHQTMEALIAAQASNVLHRDLKPTNVMVIWQPSGKFQTKILDFGLAKFSKSPSVQTMDQEDAVMGSIYFMAPEQFERAHLDQRSDLYQIGCVYYHSLTGQYPFRGETGPQVMNAHLQHRVTPLEKLRPDLSPSICQWVMWLINRDMEKRPASAQEALDRFPKNPEPPGEAVLQAIPVEESVETTTTGVHVVVPEHDAKPPPKLIVTGSAPISPGAGKFHRHGLPSTAVDPETKKKRQIIFGSIAGVIALIAVGAFFFTNAKTNAARQTIAKLAAEEAPKGGVKEIDLALKFLNSKKASSTEKSNAGQVLSKLEGKGIDAALLKALQESEAPYARWKLCQALAYRGYSEAVPAMITAFNRSSSKSMQSDILNSIRQLAGPENAESLLDALATELEFGDRTQLESILRSIYRKETAESKVTSLLLGRMPKATNDDERYSLYRILGALGREDGLLRLKSIYKKEKDKALRKEVMAAYLNWPDRSALKSLEELITEGAGSGTAKATEAYSRIASLPAAVPIEEKIAAWKQTIGWSKVVKDFKNVFLGVIDNPTPETLAFAREYEESGGELSRYARQAASDVETLTKEAPTLDAEGRLDPELVIMRGNARGAVLRPVNDADGDPVLPPRVIHNWIYPETWFVWHFKVKAGGNFGVEISQAYPNDAPTEFQAIIGAQAFDGKSKRTKSWNDFETVAPGGTVSLEPGKVYTLFLKARGVIQPRMMDIETVRVVAK